MADSAAPAASSPPTTGALPVAIYANQFEVGYNAFEFLILFGQQFEEPTEAPAAQLRVVMPPAYAKVLLEVLGGSLAAYEAAFGAIPERPSAGGV